MGKNIDTVNALVLAWVGDARYDAYVRDRLAAESDAKVDSLQRRAVALVSARAQAAIFDAMEPELTAWEADTARRARNARSGHVAKNASAADYKKATALEAVIGAVHMAGDTARETELMQKIWETGNNL